MTEKDIKPIPKYILRMIEREDKKEYPLPSKQLRFYAYLTKYRGELVKVTVAVKHYRKKLYCKAVAWHGVHSPVCFVKDLEYCYCGSMGFRVGWYGEGIQKERRWYERGVHPERTALVRARRLLGERPLLRSVGGTRQSLFRREIPRI